MVRCLPQSAFICESALLLPFGASMCPLFKRHVQRGLPCIPFHLCMDCWASEKFVSGGGGDSSLRKKRVGFWKRGTCDRRHFQRRSLKSGPKAAQTEVSQEECPPWGMPQDDQHVVRDHVDLYMLGTP